MKDTSYVVKAISPCVCGGVPGARAGAPLRAEGCHGTGGL